MFNVHLGYNRKSLLELLKWSNLIRLISNFAKGALTSQLKLFFNIRPACSQATEERQGTQLTVECWRGAEGTPMKIIKFLCFNIDAWKLCITLMNSKASH